nr:hypothetical protein [Tanacetum cinerariifolium]
QPSLPILVQDNDSQREDIDIVTSTDDVLPPSVENDDSDGEVDDVEELRVDNSISNSKHEFSESEDSDFDNPTTLVTKEVAESSTKNLVPIPRECEVTSDNRSESIEPVKDDSSVFTTFSNPLLDDDKINSDVINSQVEYNFVESTFNHDTVKFDNLDEFSRPFIPIYIDEEERIRREHADYINRMEMLFTINPRPRPTLNANTNVEFIPSLPILVQDNDSQREDIDIV